VLLTAKNSAVLLIDLQERLVPAIADGDAMVARAGLLAEAAALLDVPVLATEQYPKGLGPTVAELAPYPSATLAKTAFSAADVPGFDGHVCVLQTVLGLLGSRHRVIVAADAIGSRDPADKALAIDRARQHGAEVVSTEMVLFEWLRDASHPAFRAVQKLLK
jgi:nicotinamidase-related amidase